MNALAKPIDDAELAPTEIIFAARCEARALLFINDQLPLHDAVDELQAYAEDSGLVDRIGQDEAQRIMGEAFAAVDLLQPDDELSEACEAEIMLRAAEVAQRWEAAYRPLLEPPRRREAYRPAESTVAAFWYVATREPEKLKAWLARHPDDAPALHQIWKAKRCS